MEVAGKCLLGDIPRYRDIGYGIWEKYCKQARLIMEAITNGPRRQMLGHECVMLERIQLLFAAKTGHGNAQPIAKWKSHFPKSQFAAVSSQKKKTSNFNRVTPLTTSYGL